MRDTHISQPNRDPLIAGLVLIVVGAGLLAVQQMPELGRYIVLAVGLGLLAIFVLNRSYGALIGGSIVTGLGVGIVLASMTSGNESGAVILLSLGAGFMAIWPLAAAFRLSDRHWWPLVPGFILLSIGTALWIGGPAFELLSYWPLILIAIGVLLVALRFVRQSDTEEA